MSMAPHCAHLRGGVKMGNFEMVETMIKDGLWDAFTGYHMARRPRMSLSAGRPHARSRTSSGGFSEQSGSGEKAGRFKDEITPVTIKTQGRCGRGRR